MPKVAVITPTYNRGRDGLLEKTMLSVLGQSHGDFVHIIIDDGSGDNTREIVEGYAKKDSRVKYFRRERTPGQKFGASPASNYGISKLNDCAPNAKYVTFLHSDDMLAKDSIEKRAKAAESRDALASYSWMGACYENMTPKIILKWPQIDDVESTARELKKQHHKQFPYHTWMLSAGLLGALRGFDENLGYGEDRDFTLSILGLLGDGDVVAVPEVLQYYRVHDNNVTALYKNQGWIPADIRYIDAKHGRTAYDAAIEKMHMILTNPHVMLPEPLKRLLRPIRDSVRDPGFEVDTFVQQIENHEKIAA